MSATVTVRVYRITRAVGSWRPQSVSRVRLRRRAYPDVIAEPDGRHGVELRRMVRVRRRRFLPRMPHIASTSLTLFLEIGGQFKIRRAEVLRGCELCDIRVLLDFETVETNDIRVLRQ